MQSTTGFLKAFDPHLSPCRGCNKEKLETVDDESVKICSVDCLDLVCWQTALAKAEQRGGLLAAFDECAICLRPEANMYCVKCRTAISDKIALRMSSLKPRATPARAQRVTGKYHYRRITKKSQKAKCEWCGCFIMPGDDAMARLCGYKKAVYKYACPDCGIEHHSKGEKKWIKNSKLANGQHRPVMCALSRVMFICHACIYQGPDQKMLLATGVGVGRGEKVMKDIKKCCDCKRFYRIENACLSLCTRPNKMTGVAESPHKTCTLERKNRFWADTCGVEAKYFKYKVVI